MLRTRTAAIAVIAATGLAAGQTPSLSFTVPDFELEPLDATTVASIDTAGFDFSEPYVAFRITTDFTQGDITGENGAFSSDFTFAFGDPSTLTLISETAAPLNAEGSPAPVPGLIFSGAFPGGFSGSLPIVDLVGFENFGFGDGSFSNTTVEWFTAADITEAVLLGSDGPPSANLPTEVIADLGVVATEGEPIEIDTVGSVIDTVIGLYALDGTLIATNDDFEPTSFDSQILIGAEDQLFFAPDGSIANLDGLAAGRYFLGIGEFFTAFDPDFETFVVADLGGIYVGRVNDQTFSGTLGISPDVDYVTFEVAAAANEPCNPADVAETNGAFGTLDGNDIAVFVSAFVAGDPLADIAETNGAFGTLDGNDIAAFVGSFLAGCPDDAG